VTELTGLGPAEGWHQDPYGRFELRFFDGQKWTPYVRNGEEHALDEPSDLLSPSPPGVRRALLDEDVLVIERFTDLGRRWSDRSVHRPDGTRIGTLRRAALLPEPPGPGARSISAREHAANDVVELVDVADRAVLTILIPMGAARTSVEVRGSEGTEAGRIVQQTVHGDRTTYSFLGPTGTFLGELRSDNWVGWDLRVVDSNDREVATITRDFSGLDLSRLPAPDDYVLRVTTPLLEPLRTMVVACALCFEVAVRPNEPGL
jgi:hypothetical protein